MKKFSSAKKQCSFLKYNAKKKEIFNNETKRLKVTTYVKISVNFYTLMSTIMARFQDLYVVKKRHRLVASCQFY